MIVRFSSPTGDVAHYVKKTPGSLELPRTLCGLRTDGYQLIMSDVVFVPCRTCERIWDLQARIESAIRRAKEGRATWQA